jgi:hypothetical protein
MTWLTLESAVVGLLAARLAAGLLAASEAGDALCASAAPPIGAILITKIDVTRAPFHPLPCHDNHCGTFAFHAS